ncbi:MAG TPA: hypothetical protein VKC57_08745, partial [Ktedonobacterales bacterium]|nr:hypothetical protein [Ktedonobacterales bacterium]
IRALGPLHARFPRRAQVLAVLRPAQRPLWRSPKPDRCHTSQKLGLRLRIPTPRAPLAGLGIVQPRQ